MENDAAEDYRNVRPCESMELLGISVGGFHCMVKRLNYRKTRIDGRAYYQIPLSVIRSYAQQKESHETTIRIRRLSMAQTGPIEGDATLAPTHQQELELLRSELREKNRIIRHLLALLDVRTTPTSILRRRGPSAKTYSINEEASPS
ncbi:MAG: hypothetical protein IPK79_02280 [Vampirovibrionales bacterium]|nr:hypothetical protein [Vampirovibrionales bacterium]